MPTKSSQLRRLLAWGLAVSHRAYISRFRLTISRTKALIRQTSLLSYSRTSHIYTVVIGSLLAVGRLAIDVEIFLNQMPELYNQKPNSINKYQSSTNRTHHTIFDTLITFQFLDFHDHSFDQLPTSQLQGIVRVVKMPSEVIPPYHLPPKLSLSVIISQILTQPPTRTLLFAFVHYLDSYVTQYYRKPKLALRDVNNRFPFSDVPELGPVQT